MKFKYYEIEPQILKNCIFNKRLYYKIFLDYKYLKLSVNFLKYENLIIINYY